MDETPLERFSRLFSRCDSSSRMTLPSPIYIRHPDAPRNAKAVRTEELIPGQVFVDRDADGRVIGVEVLL